MNNSKLKIQFSKFFLDTAPLLLIGFALPLFFVKLGQSSLVSWDEAWYAEIGRNILKTLNIFQLSWNGEPFVDHPPAGFWLIASGEKLFGYSEFGVRAASAFCGFLTLIFTYFLGKELFNRVVGLLSALALSSSFWFLYRARSGNLDVFLTMFFVLTLLLAVLSVKKRVFIIPFFFSLGLLFLTKTIVPLTILPSLFVVFWKVKLKREDVLRIFLGILICFGMVLLWVYFSLKFKSDFVERYLAIGLPGVGIKTTYIDNLALIKEYLHNGIGRWFWPGIFALSLSLFAFQKRFYILSVFFISFFGPFIFSPKGHIWHLVPLHPIMIISAFGFTYLVLDKILGLKLIEKLVNQFFEKVNVNKSLRFKLLDREFIILFLMVLGFLYIFSVQIRQAWFQVVETTKYISDEAILSKEAGKYPQKFFIDGDFGPAAVWYSEKKVQQIRNEELSELLKREGKYTNQSSFLLITKPYRIEELKIDLSQFKILKKDRDKILVLKE